jgi:Ca2+-binding EF-hand superfamily protein
MIRKSFLLGAVVALVPAALLAADPASGGRPGPRGEGNLIERFDTNKDGAISKDEATRGPLARAFDHIDTNKDGFLTQDELTAAAAARREEAQARMAARFKEVDRNGDGLLSKEEAAGLPRIERRFDQIDSNKDGHLSPEEFSAAAAHARHAWKGKPR